MATPLTPRPARRIPLARLVVGVLLHFCVPAYLVACLVAGLAIDPPVRHGADLLARMLWTGAWFVPGFLLFTGVAAAAARAIEARLPPPLPDQVAVARAQLGAARQMLRGWHDLRVDALSMRLADAGWRFADSADQRVLADLAAAARTFDAALASAAPSRRADILMLAADSLERLATAGEALAAERGRLDAGDARTVAGYIAAAYR